MRFESCFYIFITGILQVLGNSRRFGVRDPENCDVFISPN
jgi:hypothetical protein